LPAQICRYLTAPTGYLSLLSTHSPCICIGRAAAWEWMSIIFSRNATLVRHLVPNRGWGPGFGKPQFVCPAQTGANSVKLGQTKGSQNPLPKTLGKSLRAQTRADSEPCCANLAPPLPIRLGRPASKIGCVVWTICACAGRRCIASHEQTLG
jgi:hypothetical protein